MCIPLPRGFTMGVVVDADTPCPAGFTAEETPIFSGLDPGAGCAVNCSCETSSASCLGELYTYGTQAACANDVALTDGQLYGALIDTTCTATPVFDGTTNGFRLGGWSLQASCTPAGVASPSPSSWQEERKLCAAQAGLDGCDAGSVCVATDAQPQACVMTEGNAACPDPFSDEMTQWYTGLSDTRSCGPCDCDAEAGSCASATLWIGSDWSCIDQFGLTEADPKVCQSVYSPPARVIGVPDQTCPPTSEESGTLEATGQQTVCCAP
jgi:hypothetical protein